MVSLLMLSGVHRRLDRRVKSNDPKLNIPHGYLGDRTVFNLSLSFRNITLDATTARSGAHGDPT